MSDPETDVISFEISEIPKGLQEIVRLIERANITTYQGFGLPPLETIPGPSNPWLACANSLAARNTEPNSSLQDDIYNILADLLDRYQNEIDLDEFIRFGTYATLSGVGLMISYQSYLIAAGGTLGPAGIAIMGGVAVIGIAVAVYWSFRMGGALVAAIDPPVLTIDREIQFSRMREFHLDANDPEPVVNFFTLAAANEACFSALIDQLDVARAAAARNDLKWYRKHMSDLWHTQAMVAALDRAIEAETRSIVAWVEKVLDQNGAKLPEVSGMRLSEMATSLAGYRRQVQDMGFTANEFNQVLAFTRSFVPHIDRLAENAVKRLGAGSALQALNAIQVSPHPNRPLLPGIFGLHAK